MNALINLSEEELDEIKQDFKNGKVFTDGCFCGTAISNFRDKLYVVLDFSCRKSMFCDNLYYKVTDVYIVEKALNYFSREKLELLLKTIFDNESDEIISEIEGRKIAIIYDDYSNPSVEDIYLECEGLKFSDNSLKRIQKKLFKYYKKTYGYYTEAKFKDVGQFIY